MKAFILAGGFATRLWPLTEKRAKPLLPLAGKPILSHLVESVPREIPVTVSTNAAFEDGFRAWLPTVERPDVRLIVEGTRSDEHKLGALGAIAQWVSDEHIDDDLLVLTGDNYLGFRLADFLHHFKGNPLLAAHDIGDLARASAFGTVVLEKVSEVTDVKKSDLASVPSVPSVPSATPRRIAAFEEKPPHPRSTLVSTGCIVLPRSTLTILKEYAVERPDNVGGIFEEFLRRSVPVDCFVFTEPWMDIGSFGAYLDAHRALVQEKPIIGPGSTAAGAQYEGSISIGTDCRIERSTLKDCMIFDRCVIQDCTLRDCVIDNDCTLRGVDLQGKMIRAGTVLDLETDL